MRSLAVGALPRKTRWEAKEVVRVDVNGQFDTVLNFESYRDSRGLVNVLICAGDAVGIEGR